MPRMKRYIIHATVHYVVQSRETHETESGTQRPTLTVEATSERAAIDKATKERREAIGTAHWPVVSLSLGAELVRELEIERAAQ